MPNIPNDYQWTTTTGSYLQEVPRLYAKTFEVNDNEIVNALKSWASSLDANISYSEYYNKLHNATKKENWVFPYFEDTVRSFNNDWGDSFVYSTGGGNMVGSQWAGNVVQLAQNISTTYGEAQLLANNLLEADNAQKAAGVLYEPPKFYQYAANDDTVNVSFVLINTESADSYKKNYALVKKLIEENRFSRETGLLTRPPVLWSVTIPGYRAIRWASCNVNIGLLGKRLMRDKVIVPEGYKVTLTFKSLYTEPSNYMSKVRGDALE